MNQYPGLGRPLRHYPSRIHWHAYPVGHDEYCYDNTSELLPVREVAMMIIIDRLTDKPEWEKKVFSEDVVAKWRTEALHYPDDLLWRQASNGKQGKPDLESDEDSVGHFSYLRTTNPLKNIITDSIFDYVSFVIALMVFVLILQVCARTPKQSKLLHGFGSHSHVRFKGNRRQIGHTDRQGPS